MLLALRTLAMCLALGASTWPAHSQQIVTLTKQGAFDDVRMDLGNAVIATGVTIQSQGNIAAMLGRTAADLGATETVYANAEFVAFCSARYSRALMEADPSNIAFCPFTVFIYATKAKPGEVVVGYRPIVVADKQGAGALAAAAEANALLQKIIEETIK